MWHVHVRRYAHDFHPESELMNVRPGGIRLRNTFFGQGSLVRRGFADKVMNEVFVNKRAIDRVIGASVPRGPAMQAELR